MKIKTLFGKHGWLRAGALVLCACMLLSAAGLAEVPSTPKREVVYARLDGSGRVEGVYVVNCFLLDEPGVVTDYGDYAQVSNLSTTDPLIVEGDCVTCSVSRAGRFYYQGNPESRTLPWQIGIAWTLDGRAVTSAELAGATGHVTLTMDIEKDPDCGGTWFDSCALSVSVTMSGDRCAALEAPGGTVAQSGGDLLVTFTVLPGTGGQLTLEADVTNFEMDAIQIAGVPLSLSLDVESMDLSGVTDSFGDLTGGVAELADGADTLSENADLMLEGMETLQAGMAELQAGLDALNENGPALSEGAESLSSGLAEVSSQLSTFGALSGGLTELVEGSVSVQSALEALSDGLAQLSEGYDSYYAGMNAAGSSASELAAANLEAEAEMDALLETYGSLLTMMAASSDSSMDLTAAVAQVRSLLEANAQVLTAQETLIDQSADAVAQLAAGAATLSGSYASLHAGIAALQTQLSGLGDGIAALQSGMTEAAAGAAELSAGTTAYTDGVASLAEGYLQMSDGYGELVEGFVALADGIEQLADGTGELRDGVDSLSEPETMQSLADGILSRFTGSDEEAVSFASPTKNTSVEGVQFVMMVEGIHSAVEEKAETVQEEAEGFVARFLALFGK